LVGMNEAGLNAKWLRADMTDPKTQKFTMEVLDHMRNRLSDYQELYGDLYNLEATPAESTAYRLAKHDKKRFPDIITANEGATPYYTNSSHLPVGFTDDIFSALDIQDELQTRYTSGTVFHAFLGEKLPDWKAAARLVRKIAENYKLPYYTLSPTYSVCKEHGYLSGEQKICPKCGQPTEVYSRITGYYRPVQNWNDGKTQEYKDRVVYDIGSSFARHKGENKFETPLAERKTDACADAPEVSLAEDRVILFASAHCPNCKMATVFLDKAGIAYEHVIVEENEAMAKAYGITSSVPALVVIRGGQMQSYVTLAKVREYIKTQG
ncbi:MAG: ribonucleoside triphosphate reductase, partial [Clostridia bacterium]|nr:ribonucleoside triphosphate reductase [Clostridia bacterium]